MKMDFFLCQTSMTKAKKKKKIIDSHRISKLLRLEETFGGNLVQFCCSNRATWSTLAMTVSTQLLNISGEGDSTTSLSKLFLFLVILAVGKKYVS